MTDGIQFVADLITLTEAPGGRVGGSVNFRVSPIEVPHLCILLATSTYLHIRIFFTYFHRFFCLSPDQWSFSLDANPIFYVAFLIFIYFRI